MRENIIKTKSFAFAKNIIALYKVLCSKQKEFVLSKPLLRSGTIVGSLIREREHSESKKDFKYKFSIDQKEISECIYWLE